MKGKKKLYVAVLLLAAIAGTALFFRSSGLYGLLSNGMASIANQTEKFTDQDGHLIDGRYSFQVDLSDFESNIGKEIYRDGDHRIYVSWLQRAQNGGYDIGFRSSGPYSLSGATLISGLHHKMVNDHSFSTIPTAKLTVKYKEKQYTGQTSGQCGLNYKDGDCFSFSFFLSDEPIEEYVTDAGIVEITIADLYKNIWRKKSP
ncbi:hypothetical protein [Cohnella sp. JJ-181]|uniref:hypothetical protein n=1 Tax=Cohnella rhizoplanae TaxID=2974897 RepID=UPI0022FF8158|nr:hypothetical protein [Cohnella sp. JJ-181]CAI6087052.1 hypothetical protein COHCIP112018_05306 [Cohnella sp. JJ-181]